MSSTAPTVVSPSGGAPAEGLLTRGRWFAIGRMVAIGLVIAARAAGWVPEPVLWGAVAVGLYPLLRTGLEDLRDEHRVGTELFITAATVIALAGGQPIAGSILMTIILFAEFIADLNTDRARASIRQLVGTVPPFATVRREHSDVRVCIDEVRVGEVVLVRAGERLPVDGVVLAGDGAVDESPITGESLPSEKAAGARVFAGTILQWGALDVTTSSIGADTTFVAMVGDGINDAPALAQADVGIAMGAAGTQAALEAADIALMTDDLARIVTARTIATTAYRIIKQNLYFGVGVVHILGIVAVLLGYIGPIQAAVIHMGPDALVFFNSTRLLTTTFPSRRR